MLRKAQLEAEEGERRWVKRVKYCEERLASIARKALGYDDK